MIQRQVIVQGNADGSASLLFKFRVPRGLPAALVKAGWDIDHDGQLSQRELAVGLSDLSHALLADVDLEVDGQLARCQKDTDTALPRVLVDDDALSFASLWDCEARPGGDWQLLVGAKVATEIRWSLANVILARAEERREEPFTNLIRSREWLTANQ